MAHPYHHLIYQAYTDRPEDPNESTLEEHLHSILDLIGEDEYTRLDVEPHDRGYVGSVGFRYGYLAFYYFNGSDAYVQYDIVRRDELPQEKLIEYINGYWYARDIDAWKIHREVGTRTRFDELV